MRDDTPAVLDLLESRRPVIALLATEFIAALHPLTVPQIERAVAALGFYSVETTLLGEEIVAQEYERLYAREGILFALRSTCPVAVDFVRKFYPALTPALAPIVPPYVAQARLIKEVYPGDVAIVYVSPCFARKDEVYEPQFEGLIDAAIDFIELKKLIVESERRPAHGRTAEPARHRPGILKELSLTDGFPRRTLLARNMTDQDVITVRGIDALDRLMKAVVSGETAPTIVDMLMCEGCIDGPAVNPGLSLFAKRNVESVAREMPGATRVSTRALLSVLPSVDLVRSFSPDAVKVPRPSNEQVAAVLAEGGFASRSDVIDCGACGYRTCVAHAEAIFRGDSTWAMCFPLQRRRLERAEEAAEACVTLDETTGLWNRRAFTDRLELEMDRHVRYRTPLCLLLVDVDHFSSVNDLLGEEGGDDVLAALGKMFTQNLRTTDMVARFRGDQFAILLPGVPKTAAFAVAEKLRAMARRAHFDVAEGYRTDVSLTVSIGVASAGDAISDPTALIEAADAVLRQAARSGSDQVGLAPG
ncbi:MAG: diguanylate cyclase [Coriobacteriales bacterium]|nr:diguanylate cyclase [Actinomycetes bacterium]